VIKMPLYGRQLLYKVPWDHIDVTLAGILPGVTYVDTAIVEMFW
jgi:hypothetical protein